jgi:hypothetical protein
MDALIDKCYIDALMEDAVISCLLQESPSGLSVHAQSIL